MAGRWRVFWAETLPDRADLARALADAGCEVVAGRPFLRGANRCQSRVGAAGRKTSDLMTTGTMPDTGSGSPTSM